MKIKTTITYPKLQRAGSYSEPQQQTVQEIDFNASSSFNERCHEVYRRMGNWPEPDGWFPWFRKVNQEQRMYSMSVGCVIQFEDNPSRAFICDSFGWLPVTLDMLKGWLDYSDDRCAGDMIALKKWKESIGMFLD